MHSLRVFAVRVGAVLAQVWLAAIAVLVFGASPVQAVEPLRCPPDAACVVAAWPSAHPGAAAARLHAALAAKPGMTVNPLSAAGFHATYRNLFFATTDALDVQLGADPGTLMARIQSVEGGSDLFQREQALRQFRWLAQP